MERGKLPEIPVPAWPQTATARLTNHPLSNREFLEVPFIQCLKIFSQAAYKTPRNNPKNDSNYSKHFH